MKATEYEAKALLMNRLDECLLNRAVGLCADRDALTIRDVYELQGLAEVHAYLKIEHEFTAAEVEALLKFADPLEAASACWEDNPHEYSFPICELLNEVHALERFPLALAPPPPERPSLRDRLRTAVQEAHSHPPVKKDEPTPGGDSR